MREIKCHERGRAREVWRPRSDGLEECLTFVPGYNCPVITMQGHGVHGMELWWTLRGPAGAVQLGFSTDWVPGELYPGHGLSPDGTRGWRREATGTWSTDPNGLGIARHSRRPMYEDHEPEKDACLLLGGPCFYDRRYTGSDGLVVPFMAQGEQVIWDELERLYETLNGPANGGACADLFRARIEENDTDRT